MIDRYAVFGNPISHSKSPAIHRAFAAQTGQALHYTRERVEPGHFEEAATQFFAEGGLGLNITLPFKLDACRFADALSERARQAGAVNTLIRQKDGSVLGDNTDGVGLVGDITRNRRWLVAGRKLLILGAGGAVRGILGPLLQEGPAQLVIANRTVGKACELAEAFGGLGEVRGLAYADLAGSRFDLLINGTSASLAGELPPLPPNLLAPGADCYDMMYGAEPTVFMRWAREQGAAGIADGLGMLIEQAAESFYLWRGARPPTAPVIELVREGL